MGGCLFTKKVNDERFSAFFSLGISVFYCTLIMSNTQSLK